MLLERSWRVAVGCEVLIANDACEIRWRITLRPRAVPKTEGTVFPNTDRPRLVNNIFIFFYNATKSVRKTRTF